MSTSRLPERPKPPTVDQIMSDIQACKHDDIVFSYGTHGVSRDSTPASTMDSILHHEQTADDGVGDDASPNEKSPDLSDINSTYLKTLQLLGTTTILKSSSKILKEQYDQLEKLGTEVTDAIAALESAAHTVEKSS